MVIIGQPKGAGHVARELLDPVPAGTPYRIQRLMPHNDMIGSDHPLTREQRRILAIVLDLIVPANTDGSKPSAAEVDVLGYIRKFESDTLDALGTELDRLDTEARTQHGQAFVSLEAHARQAIVDGIRLNDPRFMRTLALQTVTCYYQDDRVLEALGMEARPPFPKGYEVPTGDVSLLDPVRARGEIWRRA